MAFSRQRSADIESMFSMSYIQGLDLNGRTKRPQNVDCSRNSTRTFVAEEAHFPSLQEQKEEKKYYFGFIHRAHFVAMLGEFVGTTMFLFMAFGGTQVAGSLAPTDSINSYTYIALSFGMSLLVNVWIFFRVSGAFFNPAVSLGLSLIGAVPPLRSALLFVSQIAGGIAGAALTRALLPMETGIRTTLRRSTSIPQGLFLEMFLTAELVFTIIMLVAEKHKATYLAPVGIGLAFFIAELVGVPWTGGSLNPARSLGPAVIDGIFDDYFWYVHGV